MKRRSYNKLQPIIYKATNFAFSSSLCKTLNNVQSVEYNAIVSNRVPVRVRKAYEIPHTSQRSDVFILLANTMPVEYYDVDYF